MKLTHKLVKMTALLLSVAVTLTACDSVTEPVATTITTSEITTFSADTTPPTTTSEAPTEPTTVITTQAFVPTTPTDIDDEYMSNCVFVGDSVCSGLKVYQGLLDDTQVFAVGNVGARNIHDFMFPINGGEYKIVDAVQLRQPMYIYLWMGLNDINMTTKEQYAENLRLLGEEFLKVSPYSKIIVMGMTPTATWHEWGANERIRSYNAQVKAMCDENAERGFSYLNTWEAVASDLDYLPDECQSGDGLHLSPYAYKLVLGFVCANQINYGEEFPVTTTDFPVGTTAPSNEVTTAPTTTVPETSPETEPTAEPTSEPPTDTPTDDSSDEFFE